MGHRLCGRVAWSISLESYPTRGIEILQDLISGSYVSSWWEVSSLVGLGHRFNLWDLDSVIIPGIWCWLTCDWAMRRSLRTQGYLYSTEFWEIWGGFPMWTMRGRGRGGEGPIWLAIFAVFGMEHGQVPALTLRVPTSYDQVLGSPAWPFSEQWKLDSGDFGFEGYGFSHCSTCSETNVIWNKWSSLPLQGMLYCICRLLSFSSLSDNDRVSQSINELLRHVVKASGQFSPLLVLFWPPLSHVAQSVPRSIPGYPKSPLSCRISIVFIRWKRTIIRC